MRGPFFQDSQVFSGAGRARTSVILLASLFAAACGGKALEPEYGLSIRVESDPGRPLAGAEVRLRDQRVGTTDASGVVKVKSRGAEGSVLSFQITCPDGYQSPSRPLSVVLRRLSQRDRFPEYATACRPTERTLVVAVRAEHGPNLPVMYLGREIARTDRSGAAHVSLKSPPEETVELALDTTENPRLRPRSPSARFRVGQADDLVVLDESFQLEGAPRVSRAHKGPVRIGGR
jgi:hypothetical protein